MTLYVDETGTPGAPSIIFLHGIGTSGWMWKRQTAALADFHCLNVDLPGHGKSNRVVWKSLAGTSDQIAEIIRTCATNGRAHIVGLSLGGYIALVLLERHAELVERAVISGVTVEPMPNRMWLNPQLWLMNALMKRRWFVEMQARSMQVPSDMQHDLTEGMLAMSMQTYRRIYEEAVEFTLSGALRNVSTPTLVTAGGQETEIILHAVEVIPQVMPNARGCLAPGVGHGWNVEDPDLFNAMVRAWISGETLPRRLQAVSV